MRVEGDTFALDGGVNGWTGVVVPRDIVPLDGLVGAGRAYVGWNVDAGGGALAGRWNDAIALIGGLVLYVLTLVWLHAALIGVPLLR